MILNLFGEKLGWWRGGEAMWGVGEGIIINSNRAGQWKGGVVYL